MRFPLVLVALSVLVACDRNDNPSAPSALSAATIQGVTWKLETIERANAATITIANPEAYTLVFETDGRLNVRADCNTCGGRYSLSGGSVSISQVACTRAFCGTVIDVAYASALGEVERLALDGSNRLLVQGPGLTLRFRN